MPRPTRKRAKTRPTRRSIRRIGAPPVRWTRRRSSRRRCRGRRRGRGGAWRPASAVATGVGAWRPARRWRPGRRWRPARPRRVVVAAAVVAGGWPPVASSCLAAVGRRGHVAAPRARRRARPDAEVADVAGVGRRSGRLPAALARRCARRWRARRPAPRSAAFSCWSVGDCAAPRGRSRRSSSAATPAWRRCRRARCRAARSTRASAAACPASGGPGRPRRRAAPPVRAAGATGAGRGDPRAADGRAGRG